MFKLLMVTTTIKLSLIVIVWLIGLSVIEVKATNKLKGLMSTDEYKDLQAELVYTDKFTQDQLKNYKSERGNQGEVYSSRSREYSQINCRRSFYFIYNDCEENTIVKTLSRLEDLYRQVEIKVLCQDCNINSLKWEEFTEGKIKLMFLFEWKKTIDEEKREMIERGSEFDELVVDGKISQETIEIYSRKFSIIERRVEAISEVEVADLSKYQINSRSDRELVFQQKERVKKDAEALKKHEKKSEIQQKDDARKYYCYDFRETRRLYFEESFNKKFWAKHQEEYKKHKLEKPKNRPRLLKKYLKKTNNSKSAASRSQVPAKPISTESKEPRGGATVSSSGHTPICQSKLGGKQNKKSWDLLKDKICPKDKSA